VLSLLLISYTEKRAKVRALLESEILLKMRNRTAALASYFTIIPCPGSAASKEGG
jgi:hypothetical protein